MHTIRVSDSLAKNSDSGRKKLAQEGRCRMCLHERQKRGVYVLTRHHLVPQSWFTANKLPVRLRDADANIVPLCRNCHNSVEADRWARRMLRKVLTQTEIAFVIQLRGQGWLDETYPPRGTKIGKHRDVMPAT